MVDESADVEIDFAEAPLLIEDGVPVLNPKEVLAFLRGKVPLNSKTIEGVLAQMRERGVTITEEYRRELLDLLHVVVNDVASIRRRPDGEPFTLDDQVELLEQRLMEAGLDAAEPRHLETIVRTHMNTAYTAGRLEALDTPELAEAFPYYIYRTVGDSAVRPTHAEMENKAYPRDHAIWKTWTPPNGYNCRCTIVPAALEDLQALGIQPSKVAPKLGGARVQPDDKFKFNGAEAFRQGGLAGLDSANAEAAREWIAS